MKVLLVGSLCDDKWIGSLIRNLKMSTNIDIDFFHVVNSNMRLSDASLLCDNVYVVQRHFPTVLYKIPHCSYLLSFIDVPLSLNKFLKGISGNHYYDVVNIHYPENKVLICWREFDRVSKSTIVTPWGSEVLRISNLAKMIKSSYMTHFDYIMSSDNPRFKSQLKAILNIPEEKFIDCDFGSEMIDEICRSKITKEEAKRHFGIQSQYTIVCGYNASAKQNHLKIINAIAEVRDKLAKELMIILPMTYNIKESYINEVKMKLTDIGIEYIILQNYLSNSDMVCLRKCADMFIHAQNTDANSVSLAEYLLCNCIVVNGSWLRYENREIYGTPYYIFDSFDRLPNVLIEAYHGGAKVPSKLITTISEEGWSSVVNKWIYFYKTIPEKTLYIHC